MFTALRRHLATALVAVALAGLPAPAHAFVVYDPSNYAENLLSAIQTEISNLNEEIMIAIEDNELLNQAQQLLNEAEMISNQITSLTNEALNLVKLPFDAMNSVTSLASSVSSAASKIVSTVYTIANVDELLEKQFEKTWDKLESITDVKLSIQSQYSVAYDRSQQAVKTASTVAERAQTYADSTSEILSKSRSADGIVGVAQATNEMIGVASAQLLDLSALITAKIEAEQYEAMMRQQATERARVVWDSFNSSGSGYGETY